MEIIHATWEKRNLGLDAYEVRLSKADFSDILSVITQLSEDSYTSAYVTVKMPVGNLAAMHQLEEAGFRFMETQYHMSKSLINYAPPQAMSRMRNVLVQKEVPKSREEWQNIVNDISSGMFDTDRISLDYHFKPGTACTRYQNWIMDLLEHPESRMYAYFYKNEPVGFGVVKVNKEAKLVDDIIGGLFENKQGPGFGCMMFNTALNNYHNEGLEQLVTAISSNNPNILNLNLFFGYSITKQEYVLRKTPKKT